MGEVLAASMRTWGQVPRTHMKKQGAATHAGQEDPWDLLALAKPIQQTAGSERDLVSKVRWRASDLYIKMHRCAYTGTYIHPTRKRLSKTHVIDVYPFCYTNKTSPPNKLFFQLLVVKISMTRKASGSLPASLVPGSHLPSWPVISWWPTSCWSTS